MAKRFPIWRILDGLLVVVALATVSRYLWHRYTTTTGVSVVAVRAKGDRFPDDISIGTRLDRVFDSALSPRRRALVALTQNCPGTRRSTSFLRELVRHSVPVTVITSDSPSAVRRWLQSEGIEVSEIKGIPDLRSLGVYMVPTFILLDASLTVTDIASGTLSPSDQKHFLARLEAGDAAPPALNRTIAVPSLSESELEARGRDSVALVDIAPRNQRSALSARETAAIPLDELTQRAAIELPRDKTIGIDCRASEDIHCRAAAGILKSQDFTDVVIVRAGRGQ